MQDEIRTMTSQITPKRKKIHAHSIHSLAKRTVIYSHKLPTVKYLQLIPSTFQGGSGKGRQAV